VIVVLSKHEIGQPVLAAGVAFSQAAARPSRLSYLYQHYPIVSTKWGLTTNH